MNAPDQLRRAITEERERLRAGLPTDRLAAIGMLVRTIDALPMEPDVNRQIDLVSGRRVPALGANLALQLCLEAPDDARALTLNAKESIEAWAATFLAACGRLVEAELVTGHVESGIMRLVANDDGTFVAWVATRKAPASWRERADIDWWAEWLARRSARPPDEIGSDTDERYRRLANVHLVKMDYQVGYPPDAVVGGCTVQTYRDVLGALIARALAARDRGEETEPQSELTLIDALARELHFAPEMAAAALAGFTLDRGNATYHAVPPGVALAPLVRVEPDLIVWSLSCLLSEPFFFLFRELRRRDAQDYHNSAYLRERVFRDDLYALFADKRFVTSNGRIVLRRQAGDVRTDVDAAVFDRKSGALALFELKSHDPFARTAAELTRQRDNVLYANRQIGGVLDWIKRHGADEILNRVDRRTAKSFRVQKVYPFVLGRYLVQFNDGPTPDRRAAWGTWPQVLRLRDGQPFGASDANPFGSLFTRLRSDAPPVQSPAAQLPREIVFGGARLIVFPSYGAYREQMGDAASADANAS